MLYQILVIPNLIATENDNSNWGKVGFMIKRKFRWTFEASFPKGDMPQTQVKINDRPAQPLPDMEGVGGFDYEISTILCNNIDSIAVLGDFSDPKISGLKKQSNEWLSLLGTGILKLWTGSGDLIEEWTLGGLYPLAFYFVDVDFYELPAVEICWRYSNTKYKGYFDVLPVDDWSPSLGILTKKQEETDPDSIWADYTET